MYQFESDLADDSLDAGAAMSAGVAPIAATDGERLMRFRRHRDEAALAEVVEAHAAMVWGVCSQVLRRRQDVEDAFQATFLILARKARSIRAAESAAGWLYRVAFRTSLLVRSQQRRRAEQPLVEEPASAEDQLAGLERHEQCLTLLEELHALPMRYRQPLVLCYFEGKSRREAADELGVTAASVKGLLARGTRMLRTRMVRRGVALSTAMAATTAALASAQAAAAPTLPALTTSAATLASGFAVKSMFHSTGGALKGIAAVTLAEKGIVAMTIAAAAKPAAVVLAIGLTAGLLGTAAAEKPENRKAAAGASPVLLAEAAPAAAETPSDEAEAKDVSVTATESSAPRRGAVLRPQKGYQIHAAGSLPNAVSTGVGLDLQIDPTPLAQVLAVSPDPADSGLTFTFAGEETLGVEKAAPPEGEASNAAVNLEIEYWSLKASGLEKKAQVMESKAAMLKESGQAPMTEIMEMEAEAMLARAEVKLCQSNSLRLKEAIERRHAARTSTAPPTVQPPIQTSGPIYYKSTPAPIQPAAPTPAAAPAAAGPNYYYYSPPQAPVPAALPWTPPPAAALPATPAPVTQSAAPQTNRTRLVPAAPGQPTYDDPSSPAVWKAPPTEPSDSHIDLGKQMTWDSLRAANPQVTEEQLLFGLISAAMQAAVKPPEMRETMAKLMEENSRLNKELEKHTIPQPVTRYAAEPQQPTAPAAQPAAPSRAADPSAGTVTVELGEELSYDDMVRAYNRAIDRLDRENAELQRKLEELQKATYAPPQPAYAPAPAGYPTYAPPATAESKSQAEEIEQLKKQNAELKKRLEAVYEKMPALRPW